LTVRRAALSAKTLPAVGNLCRLRTLTLSFKRLAAAYLGLDRIANSCCRIRLRRTVHLRPRGRLAVEARAIRGGIFGAPRSINGLKLSAALDGLIYVFGLAGKRLRPRRWRAL
jgi:hypothetical protein